MAWLQFHDSGQEWVDISIAALGRQGSRAALAKVSKLSCIQLAVSQHSLTWLLAVASRTVMNQPLHVHAALCSKAAMFTAECHGWMRVRAAQRLPLKCFQLAPQVLSKGNITLMIKRPVQQTFQGAR